MENDGRLNIRDQSHFLLPSSHNYSAGFPFNRGRVLAVSAPSGGHGGTRRNANTILNLLSGKGVDLSHSPKAHLKLVLNVIEINMYLAFD